MSNQRFTPEFKEAAVRQVVLHGYPVLEVSERLGILNKSLYDWMKRFDKPNSQRVKKR